MGSSFRRLDAYRRASALADELRVQVLAWPSFDRWTLGRQLMGSADSVGANIAEALGRETTPDRKRHLVIARGSLLETEHWIVTAQARGLLEAGLDARISAIARPLNGLIQRPPP